MNLEMVFEVAKEMNWTICDTLARLDMNQVPLSNEVIQLGETLGIFFKSY
jgi:hypothetical protein